MVVKIMESIIKDRLVQHLDVNGLLADSQHGFRSMRSCQTNLLAFSNEMSRLLDERRWIDVLYLDYAKAFDKVAHKRLIHLLKHHGIGGRVVQWIEAWLTNRKQKVVLNGVN